VIVPLTKTDRNHLLSFAALVFIFLEGKRSSLAQPHTPRLSRYPAAGSPFLYPVRLKYGL